MNGSQVYSKKGTSDTVTDGIPLTSVTTTINVYENVVTNSWSNCEWLVDNQAKVSVWDVLFNIFLFTVILQFLEQGERVQQRFYDVSTILCLWHALLFLSLDKSHKVSRASVVVQRECAQRLQMLFQLHALKLARVLWKRTFNDFSVRANSVLRAQVHQQW